MRRRHLSLVIAIIFMIAGFGLLFYPDISNLQKSMVHDAILSEYEGMIAQLSPDEINHHLYRAATHNAQLSPQQFALGYHAQLPDDYNQILYVQGVMAWVDIPAIDVSLPVLHGTMPSTLGQGVGHLEGTALPIGGYSTHSVLTTHSGLTGVRLFSDLHLLSYGDIFFISVLGQKLAYKVDHIYTVLPNDIDLLRVTPGKDFVTLITCTPIHVNTHRLLVRGTRIPYVPYMEDDIEPITISTGFRMRLAIFTVFLVVNFFLWRGKRKLPVIPQAT